MNTQNDTNPTVGDVVSGAGDSLVALGTLTMTLFPFAVPGIALALVAVVPLALVTVVVGLLAAVVAVPVVALRAVLRRRSARRGDRARLGVGTGDHGLMGA